MVADRIWRWVQRAILRRPVFWQEKDLRNSRIGVQHGAVEGVWRLVHTPVAFTPAGRGAWGVFGFSF